VCASWLGLGIPSQELVSLASKVLMSTLTRATITMKWRAEAWGLVTKYRNAGDEGDRFDTPGTIYIIITISFVVVRRATLCALKSCAECIGAFSSWLSKALMLFVGSFRAIGLTSAFGWICLWCCAGAGAREAG
jgi:hypothetical protein